MFSATAVTAGAVALALAATLVLQHGAGEPDPVPGAEDPTHHVAADGSGDYQTINEALAAAEEGETILVAPGTYTEHLFIDKDVTLAGDGPREEIVVEFPEGGPAQAFHHDDDEDEEISFTIVLRGSDALLRGLTIRVPLSGGGVLVDGGAPELADLSVVPHPDATVVVFPYPHPSAGWSFRFGSGSSPILRDSSWAGTLFSSGSSPTIEGNAITSGMMAMDGPGEAVVRANTFHDGASFNLDFELTGVVEGNDLGAGNIGVGSGSSMTVRDNVIRDALNVEAAIQVGETGSSATITGNTIADSAGGIYVGYGATANVDGNELTGNDFGIRWASSKTGAIEGNTVNGGDTGISIWRGNPSLVGNTVCGSGVNLEVTEIAEPVIGENDICPDKDAVPE
jgi:parallel beta-helix repeat protein